MVAAALLHVGGEQVLVHDPTVDNRPGLFFVLFSAILPDQVPSSIGYITVGTGDWRLPVFVFGWVAVNTGSFFEPVEGTDNISKAYKDIRGHSEVDERAVSVRWKREDSEIHHHLGVTQNQWS